MIVRPSDWITEKSQKTPRLFAPSLNLSQTWVKIDVCTLQGASTCTNACSYSHIICMSLVHRGHHSKSIGHSLVFKGKRSELILHHGPHSTATTWRKNNLKFTKYPGLGKWLLLVRSYMWNNLPYDLHVLSAMDSAYTFYRHLKTTLYRRDGVGSTSEWVSWRALYRFSESMYKSLSQ